MLKQILIDASNLDQTRIAVTENGKIDDFEIESNKKNSVKGDLYLAKITRVEPSLQAAFVDFGANRNGFLPLTEIHPDYFKIPSADQKEVEKLYKNLIDQDNYDIENSDNNTKKTELSKEGNNQNENEEISNNLYIKNKLNNPKKAYINFFRRYKIQEVIKPRQVILVQVNKEERGLKGAALTTFLSFAGKYCVLMPNSLNNDGISRKIGDLEERKKLKLILASVNIPKKMSVIVRTAGIGKSKKEISKDLKFLVSQWNKIREDTLKSEAPKLIYEEGNILKRTIRDLLNEDVDSMYIEGKEAFDKIKKISKNLSPGQTKKIKQHKDKDISLFAEHNIENQINDLYSLTVKLESGGSIVINTTEALVAIDVNSGKNTTERNIENTALKTNLEAASEIARQLRLRDLGGLVVIDFIDMDDYRNNFKVEKTIKSALYRDRARIQVGRISMFGLLELSRQRLRSSLIDKTFEKCHYCNGSGLILNTYAISDQIIKVIKEKLSLNKETNVNVQCNTSLAETLINKKNQEISSLENKYNAKISFVFDNKFSLHEPIVELENLKNDNNEKKNDELKKPKKKIIRKKTRVKKKTIKKNNQEENTKIEEKKSQKEEDKIEKKEKHNVKVKKLEDKNIKADDKTGWWS